jgi:hypothetical protein
MHSLRPQQKTLFDGKWKIITPMLDEFDNSFRFALGIDECKIMQ